MLSQDSAQAELTSLERREMAEMELTISVPEAGRRYFGLSRWASYQAAERGDLPTSLVAQGDEIIIRT